MNGLPGTLWLNRGRWNWRVRLPGTARRGNYPLRMPGQNLALPEAKGKSLAESIAWRMWEKASRGAISSQDGDPITIDEACARFLRWGETYYRHADGTPTRETTNCEIALRSLRAACGTMQIDDISYKDILDGRDVLVGSGLNRTTVNQRVGVWKRFFAWALDNRLCQATTKSEVWAIGALKRGRAEAPESDPVAPVDHLTVKRTLPFLPPSLRAMVTVHEACGARPGELCIMRPCDIERRRDLWIYRPASHKTQHRDRCRVVCLGPRAQRALAGVLAGKGAKQFVFSPCASIDERKLTGRHPGDRWDASGYGHAVKYAIRAARKAGVEVEDWSPNQLRHACGTRVRKRFGSEAARMVLGHAARGGITDTYTRQAVEQEMITGSARAMLSIG